MDGATIMIANDDDDAIDRSDEIVSDIISLIHSSTHSSYVSCSQLSAKLISYLSQLHIHDNQWNDIGNAVERFDQSTNHPDLHRFRQLIETISACSNDCEERNYTLGRDATTLLDSICQLQELLQSHVNLRCTILSKVIQQNDVRLLLGDLMNLTGMNVGYQAHGILCNIVHLLCQIDRMFAASNVIDHPIVSNCIRIIQTIACVYVSAVPIELNTRVVHSNGDNTQSTVTSALRLLIDLLLTNEPFPVQSDGQLSNCVFLRSIFELIEHHGEDEEFVLTLIKFILSLNLRFDHPRENPIMLTLVAVNEQISCREFIERLILLFNRGVDPIERKRNSSVVKFFKDLFGDQATTSDALLFDSDRRLIVEIISRELADRAINDEATTDYLSLLDLILCSRSIAVDTCTRVEDLQTSFRAHLYAENCLPENRLLISEILRQHNWLTTNDMPFYL